MIIITVINLIEVKCQGKHVVDLYQTMVIFNGLTVFIVQNTGHYHSLDFLVVSEILHGFI